MATNRFGKNCPWLVLAMPLVMCALPTFANPITFAQFTEQTTSGTNLVYTPLNTKGQLANGKSATSALLNTVDMKHGDKVFFDFVGQNELPLALQGPQAAHLFINGGRGASTTTYVSNNGGMLRQEFDTPVTLAFLRDLPYVPTTGKHRGQDLIDLLTVTITPITSSGFSLTGSMGSSSASDSFDSAVETITFASDFLEFTGVTNRDLGIGLSAVVPHLSLPGHFLHGFTADMTATFASNSPPVPSNVSEPLSLIFFEIGLAAMAMTRRPRTDCPENVPRGECI